jgi:putative ABC transport system permease protein
MFPRIRSFWRNVVHRRAADRELDEEISAAHADVTEECMRQGMDEDAATRAATILLGKTSVVTERIRDERTGAFLDTCLQDVRYGFRLLRSSPVFAATAILSFALGIGANTTIFSLVNALLLRELRVAQPDQLVEIGATIPSGRGTAFAYPTYEAIRDESMAFSGVLALAKNTISASIDGTTEEPVGRLVSGNFFDVLGVQARLGRVLSPGDDLPGAPDAGAVAVITDRLWQRVYGGDPAVLGAILRVDHVTFTIVGVLWPTFDDPLVGRAADFFMPIGIEPRLRRDHSVLRQSSTRWIGIVGRLAPGMTVEQATANLEPVFSRVMNQLAESHPEPDVRQRLRAQKPSLETASTGLSDLRRDFSATVLLLMGAVSLVLLVATTNVVNLLLARGVARRRELALRLAIGATRGRLVRQFLTESLLLGLGGGAVGLAIAAFGAPVLVALVSFGSSTPIVLDVQPDARVLAFAAALAVASALLAGTWPALRAARGAVAPLAYGDARTMSLTRSSTRWGRMLIAAQVALSLLLVVGAILLIATLRNMRGLNPGFDSARVLLYRLDPSRTEFNPARTMQYYRDVLERVRAMPGISAASVSAITPLSGAGMDVPLSVEGGRSDPRVWGYANVVSDGFFSTMGTPILLGRDFLPSETGAATPVAVVNDTLARRFFPGVNPIGRRIVMRDWTVEIIGVAANAKYMSLRETDMPTVYMNLIPTGEPIGLTLSVRTMGDTADLAQTVRKKLQSMAPVPVSAPRTLSMQLERSLITERLVVRLLGAFAALALVLAAVGLYGVLGHNVERRMPEIGVRLALGATRAAVLRSVLRESWIAVAAGSVVGLPLAVLLSGALERLVYQVSASDAGVLLGALACLLFVATAAAAVPAWRASRVEPMVALRHD